MTKQLSDEEIKRLLPAVRQHEQRIKAENGLNYASGGFALLEMFDYDDEFIDFTLKVGVANDCENNVTEEQVKMNRLTLELL